MNSFKRDPMWIDTEAGLRMCRYSEVKSPTGSCSIASCFSPFLYLSAVFIDPLCLLLFSISSCILSQRWAVSESEGSERKNREEREGSKKHWRAGAEGEPGSWAVRAALRCAADWDLCRGRMAVWAMWPGPLHSVLFTVCQWLSCVQLFTVVCPAPYTEQHITGKALNQLNHCHHKTDS